MNKNIKILLKIITLVILAALALLYICTPFGKSRVLGRGVYKDIFGVYYVKGFLIHYDAGHFGTSNSIPLIKKVSGADQFTFKSLSQTVAKDKKSFYLFNRSFTHEGYEYNTYQTFDGFNTDKIVKKGSYYYDDKHILFATSKLDVLDGADLNSIRFLTDETAIDSKHYYCAYKAYKLPNNFTLNSCSVEFGSDGNKIYALSFPNYNSKGVSNECFREFSVELDPKQFIPCGMFGKYGNSLYSASGDKYTIENSGNTYNEFLSSYDSCMEECPKLSER